MALQYITASAVWEDSECKHRSLGINGVRRGDKREDLYVRRKPEVCSQPLIYIIMHQDKLSGCELWMDKISGEKMLVLEA